AADTPVIDIPTVPTGDPTPGGACGQMFPADVAIITSLLARELEGARRPVVLYENGSRFTILLDGETAR
ncbi:hypothetical protein ACFTZB_38670, partial [Rhodococcus sp. NPDC057014]|uniref:hypothetical protein n=1 Tax=Rhodococcus sp. NPDC057014 TaxID=3346000 RepID=UPI00363A3D48